MKCKKHPTDLSSSVGVCASCLRQRLFDVIAVQGRAQAQHDCRKSDTQPPLPLSFPRSVSPYMPRRNSNSTTATWQPQCHHQRFYRTPHVGSSGSITVEIGNNKKSRGGIFSSLFLGLFRTKSVNLPDLESGPVSDRGVSIDSCSVSPAWFPNINPSRWKKKIRTFSIDERTCPNRCRGMSQARHTVNEYERCQSCVYTSDSQGWMQTPRRTTASTRRGHSKSLSGLTFCLSPLVRPSPNHHWSQKGLPQEMVTGESRVTLKPHVSTATSLCKNRSRKLANFGRYAYDSTY